MVCCKVRLQASFIGRVVLHGHDAGIVDKQVNLLDDSLDDRGSFPNRVELIEFNGNKGRFDILIHFRNICYDRIDLIGASGKQQNMRWIAVGQSDCRCSTYASYAGPGDEDCLDLVSLENLNQTFPAAHSSCRRHIF